MGIYIGTDSFQIVHYYYFCMGMFSFTAAIMFGFPYSLFFIMFFILHSIISWYVSYFMQKKMNKFIVIQSGSYFISHFILTILTVGFTLILWYYQVFIELFLLESIIFINYFVLFIGILWYALSRIDVVNGLFAYFDSINFKRAKKLVIKKREDLGLKKLVTDAIIDSYEPGSHLEVDSLIMSIWGKRKGNIKERIYNLEMKLCTNIIDRYRNKIQKIKSKTAITVADMKLIESYERFIKNYEKEAIKYEELFSKKGDLGKAA